MATPSCYSVHTHTGVRSHLVGEIHAADCPTPPSRSELCIDLSTENKGGKPGFLQLAIDILADISEASVAVQVVHRDSPVSR
jgi:hypothetical protein